ncbi:MAG TPA: hypothetical protein VGO16_17510 [Pseudonocardiaceae bacterium]|nr:hypothetical protein [Pseudonocardiaceae bacterium]
MIGDPASNQNAVPPTTARLVVANLIVGLPAGGAVSAVAFVVARYGPSGNTGGTSWSFRGNGALAVYGLVPAALAAGWTALALHRRSHRHWRAGGMGAGLVGALLAIADAVLMPAFGTRADRTAGPILLLALLGWVAAAPLVAATFRAPAATFSRPAANAHIAAAIVWPAAIIGGLILVGAVLPAGS